MIPKSFSDLNSVSVGCDTNQENIELTLKNDSF